MSELKSIQQRATEFENQLVKYKPRFDAILPETIRSERFIRIALDNCIRTPKLLECTPQSRLLAFFEAASLHLEPGVMGQCWVLPYKEKGAYKAQLIIGYQGYIQMGYRSGKIDLWHAGVIKEGDIFSWTDFPPQLMHQRNEKDEQRGDNIAAYSGVKLFGGEWSPHVLFADQIIKRRDRSASKGSDYSPWNQWPDDMWRKTAVRDHYKFLPMAIDDRRIARAIELDNRADVGNAQFADSEFIDDIDKELEDATPIKETNGN